MKPLFLGFVLGLHKGKFLRIFFFHHPSHLRTWGKPRTTSCFVRKDAAAFPTWYDIWVMYITLSNRYPVDIYVFNVVSDYELLLVCALLVKSSMDNAFLSFKVMYSCRVWTCRMIREKTLCVVAETPSLLRVGPLFRPQRRVPAARPAGGDEWPDSGELLLGASDISECSLEKNSPEDTESRWNEY